MYMRIDGMLDLFLSYLQQPFLIYHHNASQDNHHMGNLFLVDDPQSHNR
jgi:hypothetical protein